MTDSALFEYSPVPLWEFDLSLLADRLAAWGEVSTTTEEEIDELYGLFRLNRVNKATLRLYGHDRPEAFLAELREIVSPESLRQMLPALIALARGEAHFETETIHRHPDGRRLNLVCRLSTVPDTSRPLACVILATLDVTTVSELSGRLELLSLLPETNPNIVLIVSGRREVVYANPSARQWLAAQESASTADLLRLLPRGYADVGCGEWVGDATAEFTVSADGIVFEGKLRPLEDGERCMVTLTDVTEIQRVSTERELYYQAFSFSRNPMFITDREGRISYANPEFVRQYGVDPGRDGPTPASVLNPGPEIYEDLGIPASAYQESFRRLWESVADGGPGFWAGELPNRGADGALVWVHLYITAVRDATGRATHYLAIPVDVTEDRERERAIRLDIYRAITDLAETRDNETGRHITRVGRYSRLIAERLGQASSFCRDIEVFAPLHDIGKVGISDSILLAERRLSAEEFEIMKTHTSLGYRILADKEPLRIAAEIVHSHHERWDGGGYPQGLSGAAIPLSARIVAVVDVYDALRSRRPYKEPWDHERALREIEDGSGGHFDPVVVAAFREISDEIRGIFDELQ